MRLTWLADVLRGAGLTVVEHDGWQDRGKDLREVLGVVWHHTASGPAWSDDRVAGLLINGRPDLPGPLCQLGLDRTGRYHLIAAGKGNHNGYGTWGNQSIGIEAYNDGVGEPWPEAQVRAYCVGTAAILRHLGYGTDRVRGHKETDPDRKIDPTLDMDHMRDLVAAELDTPSPPDQEDIMATLDEVAELLDSKLAGLRANTLAELGQTGSVLIRDDRKSGSQVWVTNGIERRPVADRDEAKALERILGLPKAYPNYPTVPWALVQRIRAVVAA